MKRLLCLLHCGESRPVEFLVGFHCAAVGLAATFLRAGMEVAGVPLLGPFLAASGILQASAALSWNYRLRHLAASISFCAAAFLVAANGLDRIQAVVSWVVLLLAAVWAWYRTLADSKGEIVA